MNLDKPDLQIALVAVSFYRNAYRAAKRPIPADADRLARNLETALVTFKRQECVVPQAHWLTTAEVAERLHCSTSTALRIARRIGQRVGRQWLIPDTALPEETE